jgi:hypothetical protein
MKQVFVFGVIICTILACASKNKKQSVNIPQIQKSEKSLSITSVGETQFVLSFSFLQSSTMSQKEIDKLYQKTEKSNPSFTHPFFREYRGDTSDIVLKKHFERLGFVKDEELLLDKFIYSSKPDTSINSFSGKEIKIHFAKDTISGVKDQIIIYYEQKSDSLQARPIFHQKIEYAFLDVIPGGNKELVILVEDYLSNTYIYTFEVFEIKTKD